MHSLHDERGHIFLLHSGQRLFDQLDQVQDLVVALVVVLLHPLLADGLLGLLGPPDLRAVEHALAVPLLDPLRPRHLRLVLHCLLHLLAHRVHHLVFHFFAPQFECHAFGRDAVVHQHLFVLFRAHMGHLVLVIEDQVFHALEYFTEVVIYVAGIFCVGEDF